MPIRRSGSREVEVKLGVHSVMQCGFYTWTGEDDPVIDTRTTLFESIAEWVRTRGRLGATRTEPSAADEDAPIEIEDEPLLCRGVASNRGEHLFGMYQVLASGKNAVSSLPLNARVDRDIPQPVSVEAERITGISRYFWVLPEVGAICTIRLSAPGTSARQFSRWIKDYLRFWIPGVRRQQNEAGEIAVFSPDAEPRDGKPTRLWPRFEMGETGDATGLRRAATASRSVRAILLRGAVTPDDVRGDLGRSFEGFASMVPAEAFQRRSLRGTLIMREPTPNGLAREVVESLQARWRRDNPRLDLGFELDRQVVWMSRPKPLKQNLQLAFREATEDAVDLGALLRTLQDRFDNQVRRAVAVSAEEGE